MAKTKLDIKTLHKTLLADAKFLEKLNKVGSERMGKIMASKAKCEAIEVAAKCEVIEVAEI